MLDLFTPAAVAPTVAGAALALTLSAMAQRFYPRRWGSAGRSREAGAASPAQSGAGDVALPSHLARPGSHFGGASDAHTHPRSGSLPPRAQPTPPRDDPIAAFRHDQLYHRPRIAPIKAAHMLIEFMQAHEATGYFTPKEIDEWWRLMVYEDKLDDLHPSVVRGELAAIPNTWIGLRRLNAPEFRAVKARTGKDRSILYRIPTCRPEAGAGSGAQRSPRAEPGARSGKRPANPKKRVLTGPDAWSGETMAAEQPMRRAA